MTAPRRAGGLTLSEVVMAMAIVSLIGAASVNVYRGLADHQAYCRRQARTGQDARRTMAQVLDRLRGCRMVLAEASEDAGDAVALWREDRNDDGLMQCSEMVVLWAQPGEGLVERSIDLPESLEIVDRVIEPGSIDSVSAALAQLSTYPTRREELVLVEDVVECRFVADAVGEDCRLMSVSITLQGDGVQTRIASATTVRGARINPLPDGWRDQMLDDFEDDEDEEEGEDDEDEEEGEDDEDDKGKGGGKNPHDWWERFLEWLRQRREQRGPRNWLDFWFSACPSGDAGRGGGRRADA